MSLLIGASRRLWRRHAGVVAWLAPALILTLGLGVALWISAWRAPEFPATLARLSAAAADPAVTGADDPATARVPPAALAATLWDELFPEPPETPKPEPPPRLELELIAIIAAPPAPSASADEPATRRAVVFDKERSEMTELLVGQSLPGRPGVVLTSLTERAATFEVNGRAVTLELHP